MVDRSKYTLHNVISYGFALARRPIAAAERWCYRRGLLDRTQLHLPRFLGIGAQKAGTTWLYQNLRHHPDVYLTIPKELHYFDKHYHESLDSYSRHFDEQRFDVRGKVAGEITPEYGPLPVHRIRFLHAMQPGLRLIFLMRNPIDRAWSQAVMNLVEHTDRRFEDVPPQAFFAHFEEERTIKRGDYATIIDRWLSVYPRAQLHLGFLEDLAQRPRQLLTEVFRHIGVTTEVDWASFPYHRKIRTGVKSEMPAKYRRFLEDLYREDLRRLAERFGRPAKQWLEALEQPP